MNTAVRIETATEARRILDEWLAYESDPVKLPARYMKRFATVLPGTKPT